MKYYHVEIGNPEVTRIVSQPGNQIRVSILGIVETQSAFAMKVRAGVLDRQSALALRARLMLDIAAGALRPYALNDDHFEAAERLITRYAFSVRLRTLDALQLPSRWTSRIRGSSITLLPQTWRCSTWPLWQASM